MSQILATEKEFFGLYNRQMNGNEYTPVSVGRKTKISDSNRTWMKSLRNLDFSNAQELRELAPEKVFKSPINYSQTYEVIDGNTQFGTLVEDDRLFGIVGEDSKKLYSVKTNQYHIIQHKDIINAFANASDDTGIRVFGKMYDRQGRMNVMTFFADADMGVEFNKGEVFALGMRVFNSHNGTTTFGGSAIAVRQMCSNLMAWGETLGQGAWKHNLHASNIIDSFVSLIKGYLDKIPVFQNRIEEMQNIILTKDEAECTLWGIGLPTTNVLSIMANIKGLNPEIQNTDEMTVWELNNAGTGYFSHRTAGDNMVASNLSGLEALEKLSVVGSYDGIIQKGAERRQKYYDSLKTMDLTNATVVSEA